MDGEPEIINIYNYLLLGRNLALALLEILKSNFFFLAIFAEVFSLALKWHFPAASLLILPFFVSFNLFVNDLFVFILIFF